MIDINYMNKIKINNYIQRKKTVFGSLKVENVLFNGIDIEEYLYKYVLDKNNLEYIFCNKVYEIRDYYRMLNRFIPSRSVINIEDFVDENLKCNKGFYSFFAEALLPLVYRDIYGFELKEAAIDITQTLIDQSTGVDGCLYDKENAVFIAGEAKFYKDFEDGLKSIISNLVSSNSIINKLGSLKRKMQHNDEMDHIILKQLGKDELIDYTLEEFLKLKIRFAGFVLHEESSINISAINNNDFYDKFWIYSQDVLNNIVSNGLNISDFDCEITIFHFFVNSKRNLIIKCINYANEMKERKDN